MDSKYVVIDTPEGGDAAFIFPAFVNHADFIRHWCPYADAWTRAVSAGFVAQNDDGSLRAYGGSTSLKLTSRASDNVLLNRLLGR